MFTGLKKQFNRLSASDKKTAIIVISLFAVFAIVAYAGSAVYANHKRNQIRTEAVLDIEHPKLKKINRAATPQEKNAFIASISNAAIKAYRKHNNYQVLPSIVVAQAIVESGWGMSKLYTKNHNVFGVKGAYHGKSANYTTEEDNGGKHFVHADFRSYPTVEDSILDHEELLKNTFIQKNHVLSYVEEAELIQHHHYATDPNYANTLIQTIRMYNLNRFDLEGLNS